MIASLIVVALALGAGASADENGMRDADDTTAQVDLKKISHSHGASQRILKHKIVAHDDWSSARLRRVRSPWHYSTLEMAFDLSGNACPEAKISIIKTDDGLKAYAGNIDLPGCPNDTFMYYDPVRIWARFDRPDDSSIVISFRKSVFGIEDHYAWSAGFSTETEDGANCRDSVPNKTQCFKGFLEHDWSE